MERKQLCSHSRRRLRRMLAAVGLLGATALHGQGYQIIGDEVV